jgi:hypothetical protein
MQCKVQVMIYIPQCCDKHPPPRSTLSRPWQAECARGKRLWARYLTVRLLAARTGTTTTELLGLGAAGVGNEESTVVGDEGLLELKGRGGVLVLGVEGNNTLGDSLTEGVELRDVTTTLDAEADVDVGELLGTDNKDGLVNLVTEERTELLVSR